MPLCHSHPLQKTGFIRHTDTSQRDSGLPDHPALAHALPSPSSTTNASGRAALLAIQRTLDQPHPAVASVATSPGAAVGHQRLEVDVGNIV